MALERELAAYKRKLPELTNDEGRFALFHEDEFVDIFDSYEDALKQGYARFKLEPFLVKQVRSLEQVQFISRFAPCHTSLAR